MIRLYSIYTPSHRVLKERFFDPSVPHDMELHLDYFENEGAGFIQDPSWRRAIVRKAAFILEILEDNWNEVFVFSDVDVQFFGSVSELVWKYMSRYDIVFQVDAPGPALCTGFFFCRGTETTLALWKQVYEGVSRTSGQFADQENVQSLVGQMPNLKWGFLPPVIVGGGTFTGKIWEPGRDLPVPEGILAHHANFTCGVPNKVSQCEHVREKLAAGDLLSLSAAYERLGGEARFE